MRTKLLIISTFLLFTKGIIAQEFLPNYTYKNAKAQAIINSLKELSKDSDDLLFLFLSSFTNYDSIYDWKMDSSKKWILYGRTADIVYNAGNTHSSSIFKVLKNQIWINSNKYTSTYDNNGNKTVSLILNWTGSSWINWLQRSYTYIGNNLVTEVYQQWNSTGNTWDSYRKIIYDYDSNSNKIMQEFQNWENNSWKGTSRKIFFYNSNNKLTKIHNKNHDTNSNWVVSTYNLFEYDVNNNLTEQIIKDSDSINLNKSTYKYDNNNREILSQSFTWDPQNLNWIEKSRNYSNWDANNNLIYNKQETVESGVYIPYSYYSAFYNLASQLIDESYGNWDSNGTSIESADSSHFFIHEIPNSINETSQISILIYPNPCNGTFSVTTENKRVIKTLEVYNVIGERILLQHTSNQVSIPNAQTGIYFVKIDDGTGIYTKKVTVQ